METRAQLEAELKSQLHVSSNSNKFPASRLTSLIQNAEKRATTLFPWVSLSRAKTTSTAAKGAGDDECYYDYPSDFRRNSIFRIRIDDKEYERKGNNSFLDFRNKFGANNATKIFANHQDFYFISPDTEVGVNNMDIWGLIESPGLPNANSETIFSGNSEEGNNAIVKLALSVAKQSTNAALSQKLEEQALLTLGKLSADEWAHYVMDQQIDTPLFDVPDFFGGVSNADYIGNFSRGRGVFF